MLDVRSSIRASMPRSCQYLTASWTAGSGTSSLLVLTSMTMGSPFQ